jgi:hypothetical protein
MSFMHPLWLCLLFLLPVPWLLKKRDFLGYPDNRLVLHLSHGKIFRCLGRLPTILAVLSLACTIIALSGPTVPSEYGLKTVKSRDIIIAVDISGSMEWEFKGSLENIPSDIPEFDKNVGKVLKPPKSVHYDKNKKATVNTAPSAKVILPKIAAAKDSVLRFVRHRYIHASGDRVGILLFEEWPRWCWPLTIDLKQAYRNGQFLDQELAGGSTNFGREPPGPIDAAIEHFKELGQSYTKVIIMVTDGESELPMDARMRLYRQLDHMDIHFYVIGIGNEISKDLIQLVEDANGKIFHVESAESMQECFDNIDAMEKMPIVIESIGEPKHIFYYFSAAAIIFLAAALFLRVLVLDF